MTQQERNQIFQEAYKEVTRCKPSSKMHGNGYMAVYPTRRQLLNKDIEEKISVEERLHRDHTQLMEAFELLQEKNENDYAEQAKEMVEHRREIEEMNKAREAEREEFRKEMEAQRADMETEREAHKREIEELKKAREADKEAIKREVFAMLMAAGQGQSVLPQVHVIYHNHVWVHMFCNSEYSILSKLWMQANIDGNPMSQEPLATSINEGSEQNTQHEVSSSQVYIFRT